MDESSLASAFARLRPLFRAHPWHGVQLGPSAPAIVTAYVEIVPTDTVKYEADKASGILRVDRPQRYSNVCPALYGFLPATYCADEVAALAAERSGRSGLVGDGDPLDVCILSEQHLPRGDVLVQAIPIGGIRLLDRGEADDKILCVLEGDAAFGGVRDLSGIPQGLLDRLRHYFLTYKTMPSGDGTVSAPTCEEAHLYGREEAHDVIRRAERDYLASFGEIARTLRLALGA
jgi:inorganic pyrophosphatase